MTVTFFLKEPSKAQSSLFARVSWKGYTMKHYPGIVVSTGKGAEEKEPGTGIAGIWDKEKQEVVVTKPKVQPQFTEINRQLKNRKKAIEEIYSSLVEKKGTYPTPEEFQHAMDLRFNPKRVTSKQPQRLTFVEFFTDFTQRTLKGQRIKPSNSAQVVARSGGKSYNNTLNKLKAFIRIKGRNLDFQDISLTFYEEFVSFLIKEHELALNSIGTHIKNIKAVLNEAKSKGHEVNPAYTSKYFRKGQRPSDSIYLTEDELKDIENLDLSGNKRLEQVRDLFLIGCRTGQRYSDWNKIVPSKVENGCIEVTQQKTGQTVAIPIHPTVQTLISKYNGILPKVISNQKINDYLKEIAQMVDSLKTFQFIKVDKGGGVIEEKIFPKYELVSSHTARRTMATLEYLAGTPTIAIMAITGHTTEKSFLSYIKVTPKEHASLVAKLWKERQSAQAPVIQLKAS
jgi:integrase